MWRVMRLLVMQDGYKTLFQLLGVVDSISRALELCCDNLAVIYFFKNTRNTSYSKHIDIKFYFVKEKVIESLITIEYTPTSHILVDTLTKDLPICVFQEYTSNKGLLKA